MDSVVSARHRDNNFNILRMFAALAVLITHSFALATGDPRAEPFRGTLGMTMGLMAVDIFFITSGFLITGSLLKRGGAIEFIWARALRIFPALVVMLVITVFGMGLFVTTLPVDQYLTSKQVYSYFVYCATLFFGVAYDLPGVFTDNPYKNAVNGSLWTLPYEVRMYAILLGLWCITRVLKGVDSKSFKVVITCLSFFFLAAIFYTRQTNSPIAPLFMLGYMFFIGSVFYLWKDKILLNKHIALPALVVLVAAANIDKTIFFVLYILLLPYIVLYFAYFPSRLVRNYNRFGDYSYGVYIYAFPVQQCLAFMMPGISVRNMIFFSLSITLVLAIASWNLVERHALLLKGKSLKYLGSIGVR